MAKKTCANSVVWQAFYPLNFDLGFTTCEKAYLKCAKQYGHGDDSFVPDGRDAAFRGFAPVDDRSQPTALIITYRRPVKARKVTASVAALMAHEAVHAWNSIMNHLGTDVAGDELAAYHIQGIAQTLIMWLDEADNARK